VASALVQLGLIEGVWAKRGDWAAQLLREEK
jgi:hypothetical protein